jgi:AmmeMemoRadiSam system protein A
MIDELQGRTLARYARRAITEALGGERAARPEAPVFAQRAATFVTLRRGGALHGCIGALEPRGTLIDDIGKNAIAAALHDPRAPSLSLREVPFLDVEVSVLSALAPIDYDGTEPGAIAALVPFRDGVVLRYGHAQGTFLPQVWETLPTAREFVRHLKRKAGLSESFWADDVHLFRYTSRKWIDRASALV